MADDLAKSFAIQRRVLGALLMREILTRYGRHNIGFLWLFVEPMLFTLGVTALWSLISADKFSNLPIVAFALTGYSSVLLWRTMPGRCLTAIGPNLALLYHRNVRVIDLFIARILLEAAGTTISLVALALFFIGFEAMGPPEDLLKVVGAWLMLGWFGAGLGITIGALAYENELVDKIWHPMSYILFPLSGAAFLVSAVPAQGREILLLFPMVHGVEMLREGWFGSAITAFYDVGYMAVVNAGLLLFGLARLRAIAETVRPQ